MPASRLLQTHQTLELQTLPPAAMSTPVFVAKELTMSVIAQIRPLALNLQLLKLAQLPLVVMFAPSWPIGNMFHLLIQPLGSMINLVVCGNFDPSANDAPPNVLASGK